MHLVKHLATTTTTSLPLSLLPLHSLCINCLFFLLLVVAKLSSEALTCAATTISLLTAPLPINNNICCVKTVFASSFTLLSSRSELFSPGTEAHYCKHVGHRRFCTLHSFSHWEFLLTPHLQCNTPRFLLLFHFSQSPLKPLFYREGLLSNKCHQRSSSLQSHFGNPQSPRSGVLLQAWVLEHLSFGNILGVQIQGQRVQHKKDCFFSTVCFGAFYICMWSGSPATFSDKYPDKQEFTLSRVSNRQHTASSCVSCLHEWIGPLVC